MEVEVVKSRWTGERIARLGFLIGRGWDAKRISVDPLIKATPNNVHRQAQRFGLAFREAGEGTPVKLSGEVGLKLDAAASSRGMTREKFLQSFLQIATSEESLIDNIMDDQ